MAKQFTIYINPKNALRPKMGLRMAATIPNTQNHEYFHLSILKPVSSSPNLQTKLEMKNRPARSGPSKQLNKK